MSETPSAYSDLARVASLAKTLSDTGFERTAALADGWVCGESLSSPLVAYVRWRQEVIQLAIDDLAILTTVMQTVGFSPVGFAAVPVMAGVRDSFEPDGLGSSESMPMAEVAGLPELYDALAAAFGATRGTGVLAPIHAFLLATAKLPKTTEAERLVVQRVGQDLFRKALMKRCSGRCQVTGIQLPALLRASHIKPWARCASDDERLDPENGLLLAVQWDAVLDQGFLSFTDEGDAIWSSMLSEDLREHLALGSFPSLSFSTATMKYLDWHRRYIFESGSGSRSS